jgi:hypothetical protein
VFDHPAFGSTFGYFASEDYEPGELVCGADCPHREIPREELPWQP